MSHASFERQGTPDEPPTNALSSIDGLTSMATVIRVDAPKPGGDGVQHDSDVTSRPT